MPLLTCHESIQLWYCWCVLTPCSKPCIYFYALITQKVTELIPWHTKSKIKLREAYSHISMDSLWKVQKTPADDRLSARNGKSQRTQQRNTCTSIFPLLVKIKIERLRPLFSAEINTREVLDTLSRVLVTPSIVQYSPHALTLRRLMSYVYGAPILDVSRSHTTTQHRR